MHLLVPVCRRNDDEAAESRAGLVTQNKAIRLKLTGWPCVSPYPTSAYSRSRNFTPRLSASRFTAMMSSPGTVTAVATTSGI
jgi:hypothetical protein